MVEHDSFMQKALSLANIRKGFTRANPAVGALVVKEGKILAQGYHYGAGYPHAEVEALKNLTVEQCQGASLYVTLEPCCHYGKTPPCTDLIIAKQIKQVIYGFLDPNPSVAGQGIAQLEKAGIECIQLCSPEIKTFYQSYAFWNVYQRPYIIYKLAMTLDSKIAGPNGQPAAISGEHARDYTHESRKKADAIMTTAETIISDNPKLNVRLGNQILSKPILILDRRARLTGHEQIFSVNDQDFFIFHQKPYQNFNKTSLTHFIHLEPKANHELLNLNDILSWAGKKGIFELWVEAGSNLLISLLNEHLIQSLLIYIAPHVLGTGLNAFANNTPPLSLISSAKNVQWKNLGTDGLLKIDY